MPTETEAVTYRMNHDKLRDLGAFALGAMQEVAARHPSTEVREFARKQLEHWADHGYIEVDES